jgi:pyocin large subunit-like protein
MSIELVNLSLIQKNLSSAEHSILNILAYRANDNSHECWPSAKSLCESTSLDKKTVYKCLLSLSDKNLIIKTGRMTGRTKSTPVYKLTLSAPKNGSAQKLSVPVFSGSTPKNGSAKRTQKRVMERSDLKDQRKGDFLSSSGPKAIKNIIEKLKSSF